MKEGVLYVATGTSLTNEAAISAKSVKEHENLPVTLATDEPSGKDVFDHEIIIPDPEYSFIDKIKGMMKSPYERTLFLDTDIYAADGFSNLFEILERFDLVAAINHDRTSFELENIPKSFPEYNTGVIAYKTSKVMDFMEKWFQYCKKESSNHPHDQASFRSVLFNSEVRVATIPPEYNCMVRYPGHVYDEVKLFHNRLLDIDSPGADQNIQTSPAVSKINSSNGHRVYYPAGGVFKDNKQIKLVRINRRDSWLFRIVSSIRNLGLVQSLNSALLQR